MNDVFPLYARINDAPIVLEKIKRNKAEYWCQSGYWSASVTYNNGSYEVVSSDGNTSWEFEEISREEYFRRSWPYALKEFKKSKSLFLL